MGQTVTKRKENPQKTGRPSAYDSTVHPDQARKLCLLGATDDEMADFFGIAPRTMDDWKARHPEFLRSIKETKELADADVAQRLYERAMGYSHKAEKLFQYEGKVVRAKYTEHFPPDATSMIFWLKNRQPERWRDKIEHTGPNGGPIAIEIVRFTDGAAKRG